MQETREQRLRRLATKQGFAIQKSRFFRSVNHNDFGGYRIVDPDRNWIVAGARFDLDLEDVERWLSQVA